MTYSDRSFRNSKACTASLLFFLVNVQIPICFSTDLPKKKDKMKRVFKYSGSEVNVVIKPILKSNHTYEIERSVEEWGCTSRLTLWCRFYGNAKLCAENIVRRPWPKGKQGINKKAWAWNHNLKMVFVSSYLSVCNNSEPKLFRWSWYGKCCP